MTEVTATAGLNTEKLQQDAVIPAARNSINSTVSPQSVRFNGITALRMKTATPNTVLAVLSFLSVFIADPFA
jgi:hypothetical protein